MKTAITKSVWEIFDLITDLEGVSFAEAIRRIKTTLCDYSSQCDISKEAKDERNDYLLFINKRKDREV